VTNETFINTLRLSKDLRNELRVLSYVFPFKITKYVIDELIDWNFVPHDPLYQLAFPQKGMLSKSDFEWMQQCLQQGSDKSEMHRLGRTIRDKMMISYSKPIIEFSNINNVELVPGLWHQFPQTVLLFPKPLQECFAHCSYCGRWVMHDNAANGFMYQSPTFPIPYLSKNKKITDVLITGGDSLYARAKVLEQYIDPILKIENIQTIRLATKSLTYWPNRFITDNDSGDLLALFNKIVSRGKHLSIMAHITHHRELATETVKQAIARIRSTGAVIRCQSPLARHINDSAGILWELWREEVRLGLVPYYLFFDDSSNLNNYFKIPIEKALNLYKSSQMELSGLAKTLHGPVFNNIRGKILVQDVVEIKGRKAFCLKYLQSNHPEKINKLFFARFDEKAIDFDQLKPVSKYDESFY
jgi:KamA family protein